METKYRVEFLYNDTYKVIMIQTVFGNRISVDESEPNKITKKTVFNGSLSDCYAFIMLRQGGYLY